MAFKINKQLLARIEAEQEKLNDQATEAETLAEELRSVHDDMQAEYDDRSERWQESERAEATSTWLEELDQVISDLDDLATSAREQADALGNITQEPEY